MLKRAAALGLAGPLITALLAACGGSDSNEPAATTASGAAAPTATTARPTAAAASSPAGAAQASPATGAAASPVAAGKPGGTLKYGILRDPTGFDPHIDYGHTTSTIQGNIYDTLVTYDLDGNFVPMLATSWQNPDDKTYVFKLRQGVKFHDGSPFTAADVIFSFDRMLNPQTNATQRPALSNMATYEATGENEIKVVLKQPYATFLAVLASRECAIISKKWTEAGGTYVNAANGTGPFKFESYEPNVQCTLAKNPNYWEPGLPYLDKMIQVPYADDAARVNSLKSGGSNFTAYIPWQNMKELGADPNFTLYKGFDVFNLVRFNPKRPPLDNPLVRQALNYAVDRKGVIDVGFGGEGLPITVGLIHPDSIWYNKELDGTWKFDQAKAKDLLAQAGFPNPADIQLTMRASQISVHFDSAQVVAQNLQALGIKVQIEPQDTAALLQRRQTGDYQLMFDGLNLPWADPDFYSTFFSTEGTAHAKAVGYSNADLDRLLSEGRTTLDPAKRKTIYKQAEEVLLKDPPWIFLNWRPQAEASAKNVQGYARIKGLGTFSEAYMERVWIR